MARSTARRRSPRRRWSARVTARSNALDLDRSVFTWKDPHRIALSLKRSARTQLSSQERALSFGDVDVTFYINRAGDTLGSRQRRAHERAKDELHEAFAKNAKPSVRSKKGARR